MRTVVLVNDKVDEAAYLPRYCYSVVNRSFVAFLVAVAADRSSAVPEALDLHLAREPERDSRDALACLFDGPSC